VTTASEIRVQIPALFPLFYHRAMANFNLIVSQDPSNTQRGYAELSDAEALALAQFVKRVGWDELRGNAADDAEAYQIRSAVEKLQTALAGAGVAPR